MVWEYHLEDSKIGRRVEEYLRHTVRAEGKHVKSVGEDFLAVQCGWMGEQATTEMLDAVYGKVFKTFGYKSGGVSVLQSLTMDVFGVGMTGMRFVRKLELMWLVEGGGQGDIEPLRDPGHWRKRRRRDFIHRPSWRSCFESLLQSPARHCSP
jgi:hypothetical protein